MSRSAVEAWRPSWTFRKNSRVHANRVGLLAFVRGQRRLVEDDRLPEVEGIEAEALAQLLDDLEVGLVSAHDLGGQLVAPIARRQPAGRGGPGESPPDDLGEPV